MTTVRLFGILQDLTYLTLNVLVTTIDREVEVIWVRGNLFYPKGTSRIFNSLLETPVGSWEIFVPSGKLLGYIKLSLLLQLSRYLFRSAIALLHYLGVFLSLYLSKLSV